LIIDRANELTVELARRVAKVGGVVVFEPGYLPSRSAEPRPSIVERIMQYVDILKYSEELPYGHKAFRDARPRNAPKLKMIIETRGPRGVRFLRGNKEIRLTTTPIMKVVDSAGAGDAFMAGFLQGLGIAGLSELECVPNAVIEGALERGQALGGLACLFIGSKGILYSRTDAEIERAVSRTIVRQRPPGHFGRELLCSGIAVPDDVMGGAEVCLACRIPPKRPRSV